MMKPAEIDAWTYQDSVEGRCSFWDVGSPKPTHSAAPSDTVAAVTYTAHVINLDEVPARRLKRDVMKVYQDLGGVEYLKQVAQSDPAQFNKMLLRILPQSVEADVRAEFANISRDLTSLTVDQLKAMAVQYLAQHAIDVTPPDPAPDPEGSR